MQISEKLRNDIALFLTNIGIAEADQIAHKSGRTRHTVYRVWRDIKAGKPIEVSPVSVGLAELAATKKKEHKDFHKRLRLAERQLSAA